MKKLLFIVVLAAAATQLKAQEKFQVTPSDKLPTLLAPQLFMHKSNGAGKAWAPLAKLGGQAANQQTAAATTIVYSTMPIAQAQSTDRMPVAKLAEGMVYTMPVAKITVVNPLTTALTPVP